MLFLVGQNFRSNILVGPTIEVTVGRMAFLE